MASGLVLEWDGCWGKFSFKDIQFKKISSPVKMLETPAWRWHSHNNVLNSMMCQPSFLVALHFYIY